jgi:uncharacterized membrane protein
VVNSSWWCRGRGDCQVDGTVCGVQVGGTVGGVQGTVGGVQGTVGGVQVDGTVVLHEETRIPRANRGQGNAFLALTQATIHSRVHWFYFV